MKKSFAKVLLCAILCIAMLFSLSACAFFDGIKGESAYEIAVRNGFEGTEAEWLDSLKTTVTIKDTTNQFNVTVNGSQDATVAANIGLKSIVSVVANFTQSTSGYPTFRPTEETYTQSGAGVIYQLQEDGSAYVITNYHVVYSSDASASNKISADIQLYLYGLELAQYAIPAKYVGGSMRYDIAVLKVTASDVVKTAMQNNAVQNIQFANSDNIVVGQTVVAIGNPAALGISVSSGLVSVDSEYIQLTAADDKTTISMRVLRTDTAINSGNSGGGLFDINGNLLGIVNAKISSSTIENIGYAIPSNVVKAAVENIMYNCDGTNNTSLMRALIGVTVTAIEQSTSIDNTTGNLIKTEKIQVKSITTGGLADGKLQEGDILTSITIDGITTNITRQFHLLDAMLFAHSGSQVQISYVRNGENFTESFVISANDLTEY